MSIDQFVDREVERSLRELRIHFDVKQAYALYAHIGMQPDYAKYQNYLNQLNGIVSEWTQQRRERHDG